MLALVKTNSKQGLQLIQKSEPKVKEENEILIEIGACGICGSDLKSYLSDEDLLSYLSRYGWPISLGHEIGGTVCEVGSGITEFKEGDRVTCNADPPCGYCFHCIRGQTNLCINRNMQNRIGGFARYALVTPAYLYKLPKIVPVEEAALVEPLGVALRAIERSRLKPGDSALIIGPGSLGILATMLLKSAGIRPLVVAGRKTSRERLKVAAEIGAMTIEIDGNNLLDEIRSLTGGLGVDAVFDFTGDSEVMSESIEVVRIGGELLVVAGGKACEFNEHQAVLKELTILTVRALQSSTWQRSVNLVSSRTIDIRKVISHILPLEEYEKAFQLLRKREALKVILTP
ncbi:zinc-binding dehydrogenase [Chloroflexota bacterium]